MSGLKKWGVSVCARVLQAVGRMGNNNTRNLGRWADEGCREPPDHFLMHPEAHCHHQVEGRDKIFSPGLLSAPRGPCNQRQIHKRKAYTFIYCKFSVTREPS